MPVGGYLRLAPLQRSTAPIVPTLQLTRNRDWIGTWRSPQFLGEMGHALDPAAPGGLIGGLAGVGTPVPWDGGAALPLALPDADPEPAAVQRAASGRRAALSRATRWFRRPPAAASAVEVSSAAGENRLGAQSTTARVLPVPRPPPAVIIVPQPSRRWSSAVPGASPPGW